MVNTGSPVMGGSSSCVIMGERMGADGTRGWWGACVMNILSLAVAWCANDPGAD